MKTLLRAVALVLWLSTFALAQSPAPAASPTPEDTTLQVYYHRQYYEADWRSSRLPGHLLRESLIVLCVVGGLLGLRKATWRNRLT